MAGMEMGSLETQRMIRSSPKRSGRRLICGCCAVFAGMLAAAVIVLVILGVTVFRPRNARVEVERVRFENLEVGSLTSSTSLLNVTLDMEVSVANPNRASFKYSNSTAYVYYHANGVAEVAIPAGKVGARSTDLIHTTTKVFADKFLLTTGLLSDLMSGDFPFSLHVELSGRVNVLNIVKKHARTSTDCDAVYALQSQSLTNLTCQHHFHL